MTKVQPDNPLASKARQYGEFYSPDAATTAASKKLVMGAGDWQQQHFAEPQPFIPEAQSPPQSQPQPHPQYQQQQPQYQQQPPQPQ